MVAAVRDSKYEKWLTDAVLHWLTLSFGKIGYILPTVDHSVPCCKVVYLPKCQLESRLRDGAVFGRIYQNRPPLACAR